MPTVNDLKRTARNLKIRGRSKMNKAQLITAITASRSVSVKSRKPSKKKSRKPSKKKSRKPSKKKSRKPSKKKSRKPSKKKSRKKSRKPAKKKSRKPSKKKSRKPSKKNVRQAPPSGVIKKENLQVGALRVGADGKQKYVVYQVVSRGKKIKRWKKLNTDPRKNKFRLSTDSDSDWDDDDEEERQMNEYQKQQLFKKEREKTRLYNVAIDKMLKSRKKQKKQVNVHDIRRELNSCKEKLARMQKKESKKSKSVKRKVSRKRRSVKLKKN